MFDHEGLVQLGKELATTDVDDASDAELLAAAVDLEHLESKLGAARAHVAAALDARGTCFDRFGLRTAAWLARDAATSSTATRASLRLGRALRTHFTELDDAVTAGDVSIEHAHAIVSAANPRNVDAIAAAQRELLDDATGHLFDAWRSTLRRYAELVDHDGPHDPNRDLARFVPGLDGTGQLHAQFTPDRFAGLHEKANDKADELFRHYRDLHTLDPTIAIPPRATLLALALDALIFDGAAIDLHATKPARTDVTFIIRTDEHGHDHAYDRDGIELPTTILPMFLCDPDFHTVIVDSLGLPLDLGHTVRYATAAQRRAIAARDGGCAFPGCDRPVNWLDLHHCQPHHHHGPTNLTNLLGLCRLHHGVAHRHGWAVHTTPDGWYYFQTPTHHTFWAQRHSKRRTDPPPPPQPHHTDADAHHDAG